MGSERTVHCILGSNSGERRAMLCRAIFLLAGSAGVEVGRVSRAYDTPAWGDSDLAPFLNAAVELRTALGPLDLLDVVQGIEEAMGRPREHGRWEARTIDVDIALFGEETVDDARLTVPHARLHERAFALVPLLEIAPGATEPRTGRAYRKYLETLGDEAATCVDRGALVLEDADANDFGDGSLFRCKSPEATRSLGRCLGERFVGGETAALVGELGAGKTCFSAGVAEGLGIAGPLPSPSYVLVRSYEGRLRLHHADFYRVAPGEESDLASLGLEDYLDDSGAVVLVEWADNFPDWLEPPFWVVELTGSGDGERFVMVRKVEG